MSEPLTRTELDSLRLKLFEPDGVKLSESTFTRLLDMAERAESAERRADELTTFLREHGVVLRSLLDCALDEFDQPGALQLTRKRHEAADAALSVVLKRIELAERRKVMNEQTNETCACDEYRRLHREYFELERAQAAGARNGPQVVKLTDECNDKGIILVPGGDRSPDPKCPVHGTPGRRPWTAEEMRALDEAFEVCLRLLPEIPIEAKLKALSKLAELRAKR